MIAAMNFYRTYWHWRRKSNRKKNAKLFGSFGLGLFNSC